MDILAVGDFTNGLQDSAVNNLNFQPSVGTTFLVSMAGAWDTYTQITNGTIAAYVRQGFNLANDINAIYLNKLFITNTNYLRIFPTSAGQFYCAVQVA